MGINVCSFARPPGETECLEAIWSQGKGCKTCKVICYRRGMTASEVSRDNRRLVSANLSRKHERYSVS